MLACRLSFKTAAEKKSFGEKSNRKLLEWPTISAYAERPRKFNSIAAYMYPWLSKVSKCTGEKFLRLSFFQTLKLHVQNFETWKVDLLLSDVIKYNGTTFSTERRKLTLVPAS